MWTNIEEREKEKRERERERERERQREREERHISICITTQSYFRKGEETFIKKYWLLSYQYVDGSLTVLFI